MVTLDRVDRQQDKVHNEQRQAVAMARRHTSAVRGARIVSGASATNAAVSDNVRFVGR